MNKEITHPNTAPIKKAKRKSPDSADKDMLFCFKMIPISQAKVQKLIDELETWPEKNPKEKTITAFYRSHGLTRSTFYSLIAKHPALKESHEIAMRTLGERLWGKAVDKEADWKPIHFNLHNYAPEFKENYAFHAAMSAKDQQANETKFVVIERFPETSIVPVKIVDKE
jgi:hypothetical protein